PNTGQERAVMNSPGSGPVASLAFASDGKSMAAVTGDGGIRLWETADDVQARRGHDRVGRYPLALQDHTDPERRYQNDRGALAVLAKKTGQLRDVERDCRETLAAAAARADGSPAPEHLLDLAHTRHDLSLLLFNTGRTEEAVAVERQAVAAAEQAVL